MSVLPVDGCRHCGERQLGHGQLWTEGVGWHGYEAPGRELLRSRISVRLEQIRARLGRQP